MSNEGVHFNRELDLKLKRECQAKFEETHSREEIINIIGTNNLDKGEGNDYQNRTQQRPVR